MNFYRSRLTARSVLSLPALSLSKGRRAYHLLSLPLIRFLINLGGSIFSWQTLIGHCTLPEGIGSNGFSDRRILSFVRTVYYLHHGFPTQTEQPRCSGTRNSSVNRNCTVLHAKPSTWFYGRISWVSRNHFSLLPRANVERDSAGGKEDCEFRIAKLGTRPKGGSPKDNFGFFKRETRETLERRDEEKHRA